MTGVRNVLTFDIEDWFHLLGIDTVADAAGWPALQSLVEPCTERILSLLAEHHVHATFFVLGWVAERYPTLARKIAAAGHEVGTHGFWHRRVSTLDRVEFREELCRSIGVLQDQTGQPVYGFRAPGFSIRPDDRWAFDVMLDVGLRYDASCIASRDRRGSYACMQRPHVIATGTVAQELFEVPLNVVNPLGRNFRFSGGGYLRLLPTAFIHHAVRRLNARGLPAVIYLHPRDFADRCPRADGPWHRHLMNNVGLHTTVPKVTHLLRTFRFETCESVLGLRPSAVSAGGVYPGDERSQHTFEPAMLHYDAGGTDARPRPAFPQVVVSRLRLDALTERSCVEHIMEQLAAGRGGWVGTPNLDHLRRCRGDRSYASLINHADLRTADGMTLVWASRLQRTPLPERVAGSNLISSLSAAAAARGRSIFLLGGDPGTADAARNVLLARHPQLRVVGTHCPAVGFEHRPEELDHIVRVLRQASPDIVFVALGSPKQEQFIARFRQVCPSAWWLGVGISFSFVAGTVRRAPVWMQRSGLEWVHRLSQEPRRLWVRYLAYGIPFAVYTLSRAAIRGLTKRASSLSKTTSDPSLLPANPPDARAAVLNESPELVA